MKQKEIKRKNKKKKLRRVKIGDPVSYLGIIVLDRKDKKFGRLICLRRINKEVVAIDLSPIRKRDEMPKQIKHSEFKVVGTYVGKISDPTGKTKGKIKLIRASDVIIEISYF